MPWGSSCSKQRLGILEKSVDFLRTPNRQRKTQIIGLRATTLEKWYGNNINSCSQHGSPEFDNELEEIPLCIARKVRFFSTKDV